MSSETYHTSIMMSSHTPTKRDDFFFAWCYNNRRVRYFPFLGWHIYSIVLFVNRYTKLKAFSSSEEASFALSILEEKRSGVYVEIGASHYKDGNTTYDLEASYGWSGVALEIDKELAALYNKNRSNPCIEHDATSFDYGKYFLENNFPKQIDFLSIDIDFSPEIANLLALIKLPLTDYRFSIISIEHGYVHDYRRESLRAAQRTLLTGLGYELLVHGPADDWWVDPTAVPFDKYDHSRAIGNPGFASRDSA